MGIAAARLSYGTLSHLTERQFQISLELLRKTLGTPVALNYQQVVGTRACSTKSKDMRRTKPR